MDVDDYCPPKFKMNTYFTIEAYIKKHHLSCKYLRVVTITTFCCAYDCSTTDRFIALVGRLTLDRRK